MSELLDEMVAARQLSAGDALYLEREAQVHHPDLVENESAVLRWLAQEYDVAFTDLDGLEPDRELLSLFPARVLLKEELLPLRRSGDDAVEIAVSRLFAPEGLDMLKALTGARLMPVLAPREAILRELKKHLGVGADTLGTLDERSPIQVLEDSDNDDVDLAEAAEDASIIRFVNQVLTDAIAFRATDIHLEPFEDELRIRYRIDGVLQDVPVPPQLKRYQPAIVSRIKILSHLDIAEKRLPQDGRIKVRLKDIDVDVRVSLIPMLHGEAAVLRLLQQDSAAEGLARLRMGPKEKRFFDRLLELPHGIILVTGPTGSGKTTTLYSALNQINDSTRKIVTIEDPIEYHIRGVNQIQVSEKAGLTFARGLRAILRHDPDVVLIGEIRDGETAQIAVQASLTGHLVFSTLHTNDAPGAVTRLVDMGVEPYLVASSLEACIAQRLVRVLCPHCRAEDRSPAAQSIKRQIGVAESGLIFRAVGCELCRNTGYQGRQAIFEQMLMTDEIRELILGDCSSVAIREAARRQGMQLLSEDGWRLVRDGVTTADEVLRVSKSQTRADADAEE
ncbi:MAG: type II/IV secretion system protein [Candidatus Hydrogenedentes bacterium]|nr:type II/IV secretion system protein [Candidatus Hydrogenedentota bacterium]